MEDVVGDDDLMDSLNKRVSWGRGVYGVVYGI